MRTGLMFNMIMKIVLNIGKEQDLSDIRLKGFEIYRRTIREEFRINWEKVACRRGSENKYFREEVRLVIYEEIQKRLKIDHEEVGITKLKDDFDRIWEGMERFGELLAAEMSFKNSNRLRYWEVDRLLREKENTEEIDLDERTEWKTLYQILKIMGLKLERRNDMNMGEADEAEEGQSKKKLGEKEQVIINVGFRHETYKNYYLVRGLKRLLPAVIREMMNGKVWTEKPYFEVNGSESRIVAAMLEEERVIKNYELLRFCGEEILNYKDGSLREGLRKLLFLEQSRRREMMKENIIAAHKPEEKLEKVGKVSRAAVITSLLVAGSYQFNREDLSDLDLAGAYLRGGEFFRTKFERTNLRGANLKHADVSEACFVGADLRDLNLGVWPDLIGHKGAVNSVCFSPEGKLIASGGNDASVKIWNFTSGECLQTLLGHTNSVLSVCFSPDGKTIASGGSDARVKIWNTVSGECQTTFYQPFDRHKDSVLSVCFSPDGKRIASSSGGEYDNSVKIWDVSSEKCLHTLLGHKDSVNSVCFSPKGKRIVSSSGSFGENLIKIWDSASGECIQTISGHNDSVLSVRFSPDGKKIASSSGGENENSVKIWDSATGECLLTLLEHSGTVNSVCFSPNGRRIVTSSGGYESDNSVKIWDVLSGECVQTLLGHKDSVLSVCFSTDGKTIASGGSDQIVKIWGITSEECVQTLKGHMDKVFWLCFSPDGKRIASSSSGEYENSVMIWDVASGECVQTLLEHKGQTHVGAMVCFSPDGKLIASWEYRGFSVNILDSASGECIQTLLGECGHIVCFSPDGNRIITLSNGSVMIWDHLTGKCIQKLEGGEYSELSYMKSLCISPDGKRIASVGDGNSVKIWDALSGELLQTLNTSSVRQICFSPRGTRIASGEQDKTVKIWNASSGQCLQKLLGEEDSGHLDCFSPDGTRIVTSGCKENSAKIWDSTSGECVQTLRHLKSVNCVCFSPDGKLVASCSDDKELKIWDGLSEEEKMLFNHLDGPFWNGARSECAQTIKGISVVGEVLNKERKEETMLALRRKLGRTVEETFRCESCTVINCLIQNKNNEKVILQRNGRIYNEV